MPSTVQSVSGTNKLVVESTVKFVLRPGLVTENWNTSWFTLCAPTSVGNGSCVTEMDSPSKVIWAVRLQPVLFALKAKLTTPLVTVLIVSHDWLLVGANGASRFAVAGSTVGKTSLPAAAPSNLAVGSTKA